MIKLQYVARKHELTSMRGTVWTAYRRSFPRAVRVNNFGVQCILEVDTIVMVLILVFGAWHDP